MKLLVFRYRVPFDLGLSECLFKIPCLHGHKVSQIKVGTSHLQCDIAGITFSFYVSFQFCTLHSSLFTEI